MAADLNTVIKQLTESSIIAQGKLEPFIPPKADPKTVEELVQALVKSENLTAFQGQQVKAGKAKALILGEYTILDKIGAGGMGQVFKAQHRRMDRTVAIKMLPPAMTKDAASLARFEREVRAAAKLEHPNIVTAYDAGQANGAHFLVMQFVDGKDLSATVKKDGPLPVNKAVNYILQAARGLEFAHGEGVVHRDIKPANLLLDKKGVVKILDMGLARIEQAGGGEQAELTGTGTIMGTVDYMSPEQAVSTKNADQRADIYSLGMSLYYLLAGKAAYSGESAMEKLMAHQTQPIPSLQDTQTTVSKQLEAVFKKMAAKKMEDRYQTMSEVVEALESLGYGGSSTGRKDDVASTIGLSFADRKKLAKAKKPFGSITEVVASEKTKYFFAKMFGGAFGTIIAPILVFYLIRHLDKEDKPTAPLATTVPAATVQPVVVATNTPTQPIAPASSDVRQPWNTPAFQAWMKTVAAMPAEKQIEAVSKKLMELNPGFDGKVTPSIQNGVVVRLQFVTDNVTDISPVQALTGLTSLTCSGGTSTTKGKLSDLSPLQKMKLTYLFCPDTQVSDLSPLSEMPLTVLNCGGTQVSDLSPLQGMPLIQLVCGSTQVSDLSPLKGMPLTALFCFNTQVSDLSPLQGMNLIHVAITPNKITEGMDVIRQMKSLTAVAIGSKDKEKFPPDEFWKKYDAGEFGKPAAPAKLAYLDPAFQQWVKATQSLPAEKQVEAVSKKLTELNPGFDGKLTGADGKGPPKISNGVVMEMAIVNLDVTDISPLRALPGLKELNCSGSRTTGGSSNGKLSDLSPLQGMKLTRFECYNTQVSDLSPLQGMPLVYLICNLTQVRNLSPLRGTPLTYLSCGQTQVSDLSPLRGMPLTTLRFDYTQVSDLSPLKGMKLAIINCGVTPLSDLSPLRGMPLTLVICRSTKIVDILPLEDCKGLRTLQATKTKVTPAQVAALQAKLPDCKIEWDDPAKASAKKLAYLDPAFQQWVKATQALPAEQQIEAVSKKLMELNPGFDGKVIPTVATGVVTELQFLTDSVTDISPVRALTGLKVLHCPGSRPGRGKLSDLSPLAGMALAYLSCVHTQLSNVSSLRGMPLTTLRCGDTQVSDLAPLAGMTFTSLYCELTPVSDLSPLQECKRLVFLSVNETRVTPASVAALQKALPNCKIEWDDPAKAKTPEPASAGKK